MTTRYNITRLYVCFGFHDAREIKVVFKYETLYRISYYSRKLN